MPMIEVDEADYVQKTRVSNVAAAIGKTVEGRRRLQELAAEYVPDEVGDVPLLRREISAVEQKINDRLTAFEDAQKKKEDEATSAQATADLTRRWKAGRSALIEDGYTEESLEKLQDWMEKNGVADHRIAAAAYEKENPPPPLVETGGSSWNFFDQRDNPESGLEMLLKGDDEGFLRKQIDTSLKEVRGQR